MPSSQSLAKQNSLEVPLYTPLDAARYLRIPLWLTLSASDWPHHHLDFYERYWCNPISRNPLAADYEPAIGDKREHRITFRNLAALFISTAVFRPFLSHPRWYQQDAMHSFKMIRGVMTRFDDDAKLFTDPEWVLSRLDPIVDHSIEKDRGSLLKRITLHLTRVESREGIPVQLFPFSRDPSPDAPRSVVIDPELRFGRPTVKGAPTDVLADRWRAGDSPAELAEDYGLTTEEVDEALRYEATPCHPQFLFPFPPFCW